MSYTPSVEPDPREEKLPRWARDLLHSMRYRVERAEATAEAARVASQPESNTRIYRYGGESVGLGNGPCIEFQLSEVHRGYVHCYIERDKTGTRLNLTGGDSIQIAPRSSNAVYITVEDH